MRAAALAALRLRGGSRGAAELPRVLASERGFASDAGPLKRTPLFDYHVAHGGKMVPFAGWELPIQYKGSIMESTKQCRTESVLFDVSHMCGMSLKARHAAPARGALASRRGRRAASAQWRHQVLVALLVLHPCARHAPLRRAACRQRARQRLTRVRAQGKDVIPFIESLVVGDIGGLANGTGSLSVMTNERGGIIDDTVITKARAAWQRGRDRAA